MTERRTIGTATKNTTYAYSLDGSLASLGYPSGRTLTYGYSGAARALSAVDSANGINFATAALYAPQGALASVKYGASGGFTGIVTTNSYNQRLQPVILSAAAPTQTVLSLSYDFHLGNGNNGNVLQINNNRDNNRSQAFSYDLLNRIAFAWANGALWGERFEIDPWGNLNKIRACQLGDPCYGKPQGENLDQTSNANNRLVGYSYDAAGNMLSDGLGHSFAYDAENRIKTAAGITYTYDGDGKRLKKDTGKLYWTGTGSDPLEESDLSGGVTEQYVFFTGKRIARLEGTGANPTIHYYFSDHLGSADVVTNATGTTIEEESDYYPYGGERVITAGLNTYKFTGKERDSESGLDYFGARHYSWALGRFASADSYSAILTRRGLEIGGLPAEAASAFLYGCLENPQNWNQYSYALNSPLRFVDRTGAAPVEGHHLIPQSTQGLDVLGRDFVSKIRTGPLSGSGFPNQPGFNAMHREYNAAVEELLEKAEQASGNRATWSVSQWRAIASEILNSDEPAIRNFLDELERNNPGSKSALTATIAGYRASAWLVARIIAAGLASRIIRLPLIIFIDPRPPHRPPIKAEIINPNRRHCLIDRKTGQCVN